MGVVRALVLPVYQRYWLFHAWSEASAADKAVPRTLLSQLQAKASQSLQKQWHKLETAPEGSLNSRLLKLAQYVLSRVDPSESFLKALPQQAEAFEVTYPDGLPERLVRRRLRLLAAKAQPFHASRMRVWALALIPQLPLIPLPLPNVTLYYTAWRVASNFSAGKGAAALAGALERASDQQRLKLARQLLALQQQGLQLQPGSWTQQLVADIGRLEQQVGSSSSSSGGSGQQHKQLPVPVFDGDDELERLVQPHKRRTEPLPEAVVQQLVERYKQPHLLEHYRAANRKCLPSDTMT